MLIPGHGRTVATMKSQYLWWPLQDLNKFKVSQQIPRVDNLQTLACTEKRLVIESHWEREKSLFFVWLVAFIFALFQQILFIYLCTYTYTNCACTHACMWMCPGM